MRILVVEDYGPLREAVSAALREEGYAVDDTGDGEEGLWYARTEPYDAIILDLMLPGLDGLTLLRLLRQRNERVSVLIVTARDTVGDRVRGLDTGADDYLVKPFALEELRARVRAMVRRRYDARAPRLRIDDLEIDTPAQRVYRDGRRIELTTREFALLELLALRAGQVVSRGAIWAHVYDHNAELKSNVVDVHIVSLRKKLGPPALIHTRRGAGYMLNSECDR